MLPPVVHQFSQLIRGFVLVTGPTGSGKSTTLAAILNEINHFREDKIITIEDPVEFIYTPHKCLISQREIGKDSKSFATALTAAFREDIDVVLLGEMRDLETVRTAVTAAETGHLVFSTLHTNSAAQSIDRIIDTFPPNQQPQVRSQLSNSLQGIISQRLIPTVDGNLAPAIEIMLMNNAVKSLIRENRIYQIDTVIETHLKDGMMSMNHSLFQLIKQGIVTYETALLYSPDPITLRNMLKRTQL
jgi:twitching motility protein PilT